MDSEIQFDRVERPMGASACTSCRGALLGSYFQANGQVLCGNCAEGIRKFFQGGEGAFGRVIKATVFGIGGGLAGGVVYAGVLALVHIQAGYISLLIGFLAGKMVRKGSEGRGGVGYQILAAVITYLVIGLSITGAAFFAGEVGHKNPIAVIFICIVGSFLAPFYDATHSLLGGVITFFGLWQAWRQNAPVRINITGPHALASVGSRDPIDPTTAQSLPASVAPPLPPPSA